MDASASPMMTMTTSRIILAVQKTWELRQVEIEKDREIAERVRLRPSAA